MISAVIHTYNEEKNIARCLSSLSFVEEIILVDMGSVDNTCKIAQEFKARIYQHSYTGFVEPARNFGLEKARNDWILVVDADEEINKSLSRYLTLEIKNPKADFYRVPRKNIIFGKWVKRAGWWPDYQVRFFKKGVVTWSDRIHGIPLTRGRGEDIEAEENLSIIHYNYQSLEQFISRLNRYTTISAKELFLEGQHFSLSQLFEAPLTEFNNRFFVWEGYKDGVHGLALSLLQSFSELVTYLKLWELEGFRHERIALDELQKLYSKEYQHKQYWLIESLIKQTGSLLTHTLLRLKRKLHLYG